MLSKLDVLAVGHSPVPGLCIRMLPYRPAYWNIQNEKFRAYVEESGQEWGGHHSVFLMTYPVTTSIKTDDTTPLAALPVELAALVLWYETHSGDIVEDWKMFEQMCPMETLDSLWSVRAKIEEEQEMLKAPAELQSPAPLPIDEHGNEAKPTAAGGKASKKM